MACLRTVAVRAVRSGGRLSSTCLQRTADLDEPDGDSIELPGAATLEEELSVPVVQMQTDEFRCDRCFLVHHRSQLVTQPSGLRLCRDCS
jgi:hypothetical protein